jgi:DNA recombination protein RmuC
MESILFFASGLLLGALLVWWLLRSQKTGSGMSPELVEEQKRSAVLAGQADDLRSQMVRISSELEVVRSDLKQSEAARVKAESDAGNVQQRLKEHREELENLRVQMKDQFASIASEVVMRNAARIQEEHKEKLEDVLSPLREKIERFENQVKITHEERLREHQSLKDELGQLQSLNKSIGLEARNLVTALKGQAKTQGTWGEMILERVLESSGLVKGREYEVQSSYQTEDGRRLQPDVIINLPEGRHIVIDSKVSLIAYDRYCQAEEHDTQRALALKEHLLSIRKHVRDLGGKNYQSLYGINTLDFVLLFVPVEPAFALAVEHDQELFNEAFSQNIVLVTTSTMLATLRTIASIWRIEYQNKNALEIARQSGDLYDKFAALIDDMIAVGKKMQDAQGAYESTMNKLHMGRGNLVARVENLKKLGLKTTKQVNQRLLDRTEDLDESEPFIGVSSATS